MFTKDYSEAKKNCAAEVEVRRLEGIFTHYDQPYGTIKFADCVVTEREEPIFDFRSQGYTGEKRKQLRVSGIVTQSHWCGALWGGVPVKNRDDSRYPPGTAYSVDVKYPSDVAHMNTTTASCG